MQTPSAETTPRLELLDTPAAAAYLGVSVSFLAHARTEGRPAPRAVRLGRLVRYRREDLDAFVEQQAA